MYKGQRNGSIYGNVLGCGIVGFIYLFNFGLVARLLTQLGCLLLRLVPAGNRIGSGNGYGVHVILYEGVHVHGARGQLALNPYAGLHHSVDHIDSAGSAHADGCSTLAALGLVLKSIVEFQVGRSAGCSINLLPALRMYGHAAGHMDIAILGIAVVRSLDHCTGGTVHNSYGSRAGHANVRSADARYGLGGNLVAHAIHFVFGTKLGSQVLEYGFLNLQRRGLGNNGSLIKKIIERIVRSQEHGLQEIDAYQLLQHLLSNALNHAGEYLVSHILRLPGLHFGNQAVHNLLAQICPGLLLLRIGQALVI